MIKRTLKMAMAVVVAIVVATAGVPAQNVTPDYGDNDYRDADRSRIDRYLDVEVWTNHSDGEYYEGDNIVISFRVSRDAFVVIYSIDTRGRVNLLFPADRDRDNFIRGGATYRLPDGRDDFDLVVTGPEGVENIQIIASRERFPIPDWYPVSGLSCDWDDRHDFMDYLNNKYFVRYDGQRFAYDRTAVIIDEWEPSYFRSVYYPSYYPWTVCGNVYFDYPIGASVYIDGIYWGCAPLYVPRIYVGWHTISIYDHWGYCWESDVHITRYHTVVLDHEVVRPRPNVRSKYKEVRYAGYRNPVANGYPNFEKKRKTIIKNASITKKTIVDDGGGRTKETRTIKTGAKKHVRGESKLVKTDRGLETNGSIYGTSSQSRKSRGSTRATRIEKSGTVTSGTTSSRSRKSSVAERQTTTTRVDKGYRQSDRGGSKDKGSSSGYYQKKSGSTHQKKSTTAIRSSKVKSSGSKTKSGKSYDAGKSRSQPKSGSSTRSRTTIKQQSGSKPSGKATSRTGSRSTTTQKGSSKSGGKKP